MIISEKQTMCLLTIEKITKMNCYVFIDTNNGHYEEYYNFKSNASKEEILTLIHEMEEYGPYGRIGMKVSDLGNKLLTCGFKFKILDNPRNRLYMDREIIRGTSGNY